LHLLFAAAERSLRAYLRVILHSPDGIPAVILGIHTFGNYLQSIRICTRWCRQLL